MKEGGILKFVDIERILLNDGWYRYKITGAHYQYKHNEKPGKITISRHCKEIKRSTIYSILKQAKINYKNSRYF